MPTEGTTGSCALSAGSFPTMRGQKQAVASYITLQNSFGEFVLTVNLFILKTAYLL